MIKIYEHTNKISAFIQNKYSILSMFSLSLHRNCDAGCVNDFNTYIHVHIWKNTASNILALLDQIKEFN